MMKTETEPVCIYCKSQKVIRHGKTTTGNKRYRCRNCGKTWVLEKVETKRPDLADIAEAYLNGYTCRDLVNVYHSSPLRINQKIREFLEGCPNWEEYIDACVQHHEPQVVFLVGRNFSCASQNGRDNTKYLAMAIDAMSTVVLGFEIAEKDSPTVWINLLDRMNCRGIQCHTFMSNGSKNIEEAASIVYPYSSVRIFYYRAFRDKEISCCLARFPINNKLLNDALRIYDSLKNKNLVHYLKEITDKKIRDILLANPAVFSRRLKDRLDHRPSIRIEGLSTAFQTRFEKFHMLKDNPYPLINGWIARWMLNPIDIGFSRLSLYTQVPSYVSFKQFSCGQKPEPMYFPVDSQQLRAFIVEIAVRGLQIPNFFSRCEMKMDKCSLI